MTFSLPGVSLPRKVTMRLKYATVASVPLRSLEG